MVARFVAGWRKTGRCDRPQTPERISPKHAAILVTRAAEQMTKEQRSNRPPYQVALDTIQKPSNKGRLG